MWSIENLPNLSQDMCDKGLIELADDSYQINQTKERKLVEETLVNDSQINIPLFLNQRLNVFSETPKSRESLFLRKS